MKNNQYKQIMKPVFVKIGLLWSSQYTFVICFRFIAQKHCNQCFVENFITVSEKNFELQGLSYLQFYQNVVFRENAFKNCTRCSNSLFDL